MSIPQNVRLQGSLDFWDTQTCTAPAFETLSAQVVGMVHGAGVG